jgi:hypothetical protein
MIVAFPESGNPAIKAESLVASWEALRERLESPGWVESKSTRWSGIERRNMKPTTERSLNRPTPLK